VVEEVADAQPRGDAHDVVAKIKFESKV
jgi:hypothetical protein